MKYTIEITGQGQMLDIGAITPDAMHYIQDNFGDDADAFDAYIDALKSGDVPEEFIIFSDSLMKGIQEWRNHEIDDDDLDEYFKEEYFSFFDIYSGYNLWIDYGYLSVKNEHGDEIFGYDLSDQHEEIPHMIRNDIYIDADSIKKQEKNVLLIRETRFKGSKVGWIETDDEFDPRKLWLFGGELIFRSGGGYDDDYSPALDENNIVDEDRHYFQNVFYYGDDLTDDDEFDDDKIDGVKKIELEEGWFDPRDERVYFINPADC